jgi:hypothetical protein
VELLRKNFFGIIRKAWQSRHTLFFVNGFLLASLFYFYIEDSYEDQLFRAMAQYVKGKSAKQGSSEDALLQESVHVTHYLGQGRAAIFNSYAISALKPLLIHPVTYDLMTVNGACGSYAYILSSLLNRLNIPNRIAQMKVNGKYGGHILVEAKTAKGWVVLDGSYDVYFKKPDGSLASFADVGKNWDYYKNQVPADYDNSYRYEGVRYTNWEKIPVLMPLVKNISYLFIGKERTEGFSFRSLFLRKFHVLFLIVGVLYLLLVFTVVRKYYRKNKQAITLYLPVLFSGKRVSSMPVNDSIRKRA